MPTMIEQGIEWWQTQRRRLRRRWWAYMAIALIGTGLFLRNLQTNEPTIFAVLALIPILGLAKAWRTNGQMGTCDRMLAEGLPRRHEEHEEERLNS